MLTLIPVTACAFLALEPELRLAVPLIVGLTAVMAITLACALYFGERNTIAWSPFIILAVALILRLMFLFSPPQLSDDIYRYQWDGGNLLRGINPYAAAPSDVAPPSALSDVHSRINHSEYVTIYPPSAQVIFAAGVALGGGIFAMKSLLVLLDMALCVQLVLLLKRLEMPAWRAVLYAWNPLPILEIAGSGHVDGAGLSMLIGSVILLVMRQKNDSRRGLERWPFLLSGALMAGAGLVKLFPFMLAPVIFFLAPKSRRLHFTVGLTVTSAALVFPFLPHIVNMADSLNVYARHWEFAGFAFNAFRLISGSGTIARQVLSLCFLLIVAAVVFRFVSGTPRSVCPMAATRQALNACYAIAMAFLLLTPTLHPWYALYLAVFLPFVPGASGMVLCWAVFLIYQVQILYFSAGQWVENPYVAAAVFLAPFSAWFLSRSLAGIWQKHGGPRVSSIYP